MKLLLTSAGITNPSIRAALVGLLGKPVEEATALCVPTATYAHPMTSPADAWRFVSGNEPDCPMTEIGWRSVGVLELTALPSLDRDRWTSWVRQADVLLVGGGDPLYLVHWIRQSGLADLLSQLPDLVWVGLSAGSMALTPRVTEYFAEWTPPGGGDEAIGLVDFCLFPHLDHPDLPYNTSGHAQRWAADVTEAAYAIDDNTAVQVSGGTVEVISEGHWRHFPGAPEASG